MHVLISTSITSYNRCIVLLKDIAVAVVFSEFKCSDVFDHFAQSGLCENCAFIEKHFMKFYYRYFHRSFFFKCKHFYFQSQRIFLCKTQKYIKL